MYIDKDSLIIDGVNMGQYITEAKYSFNKLWSNDSGRNLAGKMTGTLIGIFPKITLHFRILSKTELNTISNILDSASQTLRYYDPKKNDYITINTYTGDWEMVNRGINKNQGFDCSFISKEKRS